MVKTLVALVAMIAFAVPAFAQDDVPPVELGFGYGNIDFGSEHHSGFATHQVFNLSSWFGIENYFGYYGLGEDPNFGKMELLTNVFGGKFSLRRSGHIIPYGSVGLGGSWIRLPQLGSGTNNAMAFKIGGGLDIAFHDSMAWKVDVSRMSHHFNGWESGMNISTGIVFRLNP
jgi:opacity protein-like surface antigen